MALFKCCLAPKGAAKTAPLESSSSPVTSSKSALNAKQGCLVSLQLSAGSNVPRGIHQKASDGGTGVLIGPNLVLTSHDTVSSKEQAARGEVQVVVSSGAGGKEYLERRRLLPERLFVTDPEYDVTILACESAAGLSGVTPVALEEALEIPEADVVTGSLIHVIGRPADVADLEGDHLAVVTGQGKIKSVDGPFLKFASNSETWAPGSAAFDDKGRFLFLVCGPTEGGDASSPKGKKVAAKPKKGGIQSGTTARGIIHWLGEQGFKDLARLGRDDETRPAQGLEVLAPLADETAPQAPTLLDNKIASQGLAGPRSEVGEASEEHLSMIEIAIGNGSEGRTETDFVDRLNGENGTGKQIAGEESEQTSVQEDADRARLEAPETVSGGAGSARDPKTSGTEQKEAARGPAQGALDECYVDEIGLVAAETAGVSGANGGASAYSAKISDDVLRGETVLAADLTPEFGEMVMGTAGSAAQEAVTTEKGPDGTDLNGASNKEASLGVTSAVVGPPSEEKTSPAGEATEGGLASGKEEAPAIPAAANQTAELKPGGSLKPLSVGGSSPQSTPKGAENSPKSRGSPKANGSPKSVWKHPGGNPVSSAGSSGRGGGKDTERDQKMIKHLQKQAKRAAAGAKPANGGETRGGASGQLSRKGSGRLKEKLSDSSAGLITPTGNEKKAEPESKALTPGVMAHDATAVEPAVVSTGVEMEENSKPVASETTTESDGKPTPDATENAGSAANDEPSVPSSVSGGPESAVQDKAATDTPNHAQEAETGISKERDGKSAEGEIDEKREAETEARRKAEVEEQREIAASRLKEAWGTEARRGSKDGAGVEKTGSETENEAPELLSVGKDLEIGGDRFLQFSMSVAAAKESFEKLAKREEKSPEPQRKTSSLSSQRGASKSGARREAEEATRGRRRTKGSVDTSPIDGEERMKRTGSLRRLRRTESGEKEKLGASLKGGKKMGLKPPPGLAWKAKVAEERNGTAGERNGTKKAVILGRGLVPIAGVESKRRSGDELWAAQKGLSSQGFARVSGGAAAERTLSVSDIDLESDSDASEKIVDGEKYSDGEEEVRPKEAWPEERNTEQTETERTEAERAEADTADVANGEGSTGAWKVEGASQTEETTAAADVPAESVSNPAESAPAPVNGEVAAGSVAAELPEATASDGKAHGTSESPLQVSQAETHTTEPLEGDAENATEAAAVAPTTEPGAAEAAADVIAGIIASADVSGEPAAGDAKERPSVTGSDSGVTEAAGRASEDAARTLRARSFSASSGAEASASLVKSRIEGFGRQTIEVPKPRAKTTEDKIRTAQAKLKSNVPVLGPVLGLGLEMGLQLEKKLKREEDLHGLKKATKFKVKKVTPLEVPANATGQNGGGLSPQTRGREIRPGVYESAAQSPTSPSEAGSPKFIPEVLVKVTQDISRGVNKVTHEISQGVKDGVKAVTELPGIKEGLGIIMEPIKKAEEEKKEAERKRLEAAAAKERAVAEEKQGRLDRLKVNDANETMRDIKASILGLNFGGKKKAALAGFNDPDLDADTDDAAARAVHRAKLERRVLGSFSGLLANTETLTQLTQASVEDRDRKPEHDTRRASHLWPGHVAPAGSWERVPTRLHKFVRRTGEMTLQQQAEVLWHASQDAATDPYERLAGESPETDENAVAQGIKGLPSTAALQDSQLVATVESEKVYRITKWQDDYWKKRMAGFRHENTW